MKKYWNKNFKNNELDYFTNVVENINLIIDQNITSKTYLIQQVIELIRTRLMHFTSTFTAR